MDSGRVGSEPVGFARPDAILFDFGGVVVESPFGAFTALERGAGLPAGFVRSVNVRNPDTNAWARIERGEIDVDEFCRLFADEARGLGHEIDARAVIAPLLSPAAAEHRAVPSMVAAVRACRRAGVRVGVITNNVVPMRDSPDGSWIFDTFDAVIESCVVGARKPEPEIYRLALAALGVPAERTMMLDDLGINLKTARAMGLQTVKVTDADTSAALVSGLVTEPS